MKPQPQVKEAERTATLAIDSLKKLRCQSKPNASLANVHNLFCFKRIAFQQPQAECPRAACQHGAGQSASQCPHAGLTGTCSFGQQNKERKNIGGGELTKRLHQWFIGDVQWKGGCAAAVWQSSRFHRQPLRQGTVVYSRDRPIACSRGAS